jgi:hypothetical protein
LTDGDHGTGAWTEPPHRIGVALACLHVSAAIYVALGIASPWLFAWAFDQEPDGPGRRWGIAVGVGVLVFSLALVAGIELVALGLRRRRFWAWVAGLCIFGVYAPSLFLPLGALGLWGLLDAGSRARSGSATGVESAVAGPLTSRGSPRPCRRCR